MGPNRIVDPLPGQEGFVQGNHPQFAVIEFIKLLGVGPLGPLHVAVQLGGAGREDKELDALVLAGLLKVGLEL